MLSFDCRVPMQPTDFEMRVYATVGSTLPAALVHTEPRRSLARLVVTPAIYHRPA